MRLISHNEVVDIRHERRLVSWNAHNKADLLYPANNLQCQRSFKYYNRHRRRAQEVFEEISFVLLESFMKYMYIRLFFASNYKSS